ncbi:MAG: glutathione S-transferase [SAR324 cluster bacterium]|nr:glutathione S-transferase [SAR324 cluster bacterium]
MSNTLIAISYSPWSEKARWALDHHNIRYKEREYVPMLGEVMLRTIRKNLTGKATVPVLITNGKVLTDSFDIAKHSEWYGSGTSLFPQGGEQAMLNWNQKSETALAAGRALVTHAMLNNTKALRESLPRSIPKVIHPLMEPVALMGASFIVKKYGLNSRSLPHYEEEIRNVLRALREALKQTEMYLLDYFSYADIAMAVVLQMVSPVNTRYITLGPETQECWTNSVLSQEFSDLIHWRDELYRRHRPVKNL